jgi:uncharacterized protein YkwD
MKKLLILLAAFMITAPLAQGVGAPDETRITLREELLRLINRDRKQFGLPAVQLDPFASVVADNYCREQIRNGTSGHYTLDGQAPYMRYSFAGGNDGVSENAAAWSANYHFGDRTLYEMMRRSQQAMMNEVAPHDGHRRTILDPYATHVGIGLAWDGGEFRLAQEFLRRYIDWSRALPRTASATDRVLCSGRPVRGYDIQAITVHYEPMPQQMSAVIANAIGSYSLPDRRREYLPRLHSYSRLGHGGSVEVVRQRYADGGRGDIQVADDGSFAFAVPFPDGPGVYTVVVWVRGKGGDEPIAASDVSIRVSDMAPISYSSR